MNSSLDEPRRIQVGDVIYVLFDDLCAQARMVFVHDADAREAWTAACADVLAQVPDEAQRISWAVQLSEHLLASCMGHNVQFLLCRANQVRRV